ncbi:ABC transporter permease [Pseudoduganella sp.]|uniref:ABC transporter permease n=1 Tax=Pseudoduganella sp. TaxID=1880898 RepID=UPI0035AE407E
MFATVTLRPNRWDWALLPLLLAALLAAAYGAAQMALPIASAHAATISLDPAALPGYLLRTLWRMFAALAASLVFAILFAMAAARYQLARKVLLPVLDVLQSVPILGFQAVAVLPFIALFPGRQLGLECAAIFAIFTSQAWNMAFSLYRSMRTLPAELEEASAVFRLTGWQRFWRLELPFAMPNLVWNMMMSMSGGWFFLVAAEAISVAGQDFKLPGIGSYIATAIDAGNASALAWALGAMFAAIVLYDQLFFAPLLAWTGEAGRRSWLLDCLRRSRVLRQAAGHLPRLLGAILARLPAPGAAVRKRRWRLPARAAETLLLAGCAWAAFRLIAFIHGEAGWHEVAGVMELGLVTALRVMLLTLLASLLWVPVAVWIGLRPAFAQKLQAVAQLLAAVPVNLLFPVAVYAMLHYRLDPDIWLSPLMVFGTQWYILFNVVAGASTLPGELRLAAANLGLRGWLKWKRVYLPAIFPSYVTGAMTACGGSWNASIVAEYVSWGKTTLVAHGLGSYIRQMTDAGDGPRLALGISVMCVFVLAINRFVWSRLYRE